VIIPTYNYERFIPDAINSILKQDFSQSEIEIIVVDDGSTDNTRDILRRYEGKLKYAYQENSGQAWAVKTGIGLARGEYIFILNADDVFLPGKIRKIVDIFENDKNITHIAHPTIYWHMDKDIRVKEKVPDEIKGRKINGKELLRYFYRNNKFYGGGSNYAGRAKIWKKIPINKEINMFIDEYLSIVSMNRGFVFFMEEPLSIYRIHEENYSRKELKTKIEKIVCANEAILYEVLNRNFDKEIKVLYELKTRISQIRLKEFFDNKSFHDILDLWSFVLDNRRTLGRHICKIINKYHILQRSMPAFAEKLCRFLRHKITTLH
jgi:glycosyltransferase involved in cell wall biosynthesis